MSSLDLIIFIIVALFFTRGLWIGFARQIASIAALIIGFLIAGRFYGESAVHVMPYIKNPQAGFFITYILLFLLSFVGVIFLGILLKKVIQLSLLGWFDRLLGGILGLAKGVLISCLIFMALALFISGASPFFGKSFCYPYLENCSRILITVVKDEKLRGGLLPRQPAISTFLSNTVELGKKIGGNAN